MDLVGPVVVVLLVRKVRGHRDQVSCRSALGQAWVQGQHLEESLVASVHQDRRTCVAALARLAPLQVPAAVCSGS